MSFFTFNIKTSSGKNYNTSRGQVPMGRLVGYNRCMKRLLIVFFIALLVLACSSKKRPTEDSLLAVEAMGLAEGMREAYLNKNVDGVNKFCTPDACSEIIRDMERFQTEELEFTPQWVHIKKDGSLQLKVTWEGKWSHKGIKKEERGLAVFELKGRPLRLLEITGSNPFGGPSETDFRNQIK
jgi:hypothetical protein